MTDSSIHTYAVYLTLASGSRPAGYVWNRILWDGQTSWSPPEGSAALQDDANSYPIGSTYSGSK